MSERSDYPTEREEVEALALADPTHLGVSMHRGHFVTQTYGRVARWPWDMKNGFDIAQVSDLDMDTPLNTG